MSNEDMKLPMSNEEHEYNAFRIEVLEKKILMLEKKIIEMNATIESNQNYGGCAKNKIFSWTSVITSGILLFLITDLYSKCVSQ